MRLRRINSTPLEIPAINGGGHIDGDSIPYRKGGVKAPLFLRGFISIFSVSLMVLSIASCDAKPLKVEAPASSLPSSGHQQLISYETFAKGTLLGDIIKKPELIIITNAESFKAAQTRLPTFHWEKLKGTNLDIYLVLMIFWSFKSSSAYGVEIRKIVQEGKIVRIKADLEKYSIGEPAFHVPYQVVGLRKADLGVKGEITFILLDSAGGEMIRSFSNVE